MEKALVLRGLKRQLREGYYLLGMDTATGRSAANAKKAGADLILALTSGKFRQMGRSPLASYLSFANSNEWVREFSSRELLPILGDFPVILGVNATDPFLDTNELLTYLKNSQYAGVVNYPTISLIDGQFREALEAGGITYSKEIEFIRAAKEADLFTIGFVTNTHEAELMNTVGPDILCIHLGLTEGGALSAKRVHYFKNMMTIIEQICTLMAAKNSSSILMVYGGPINEWEEVRYIYNKFSQIKGYIGGAIFERFLTEDILFSQIKRFKDPRHLHYASLTTQIIDGVDITYDSVEFAIKYIDENYANPISIDELAEFTKLSSDYLGRLFRKRTGYSFKEYLIRFRLRESISLMGPNNLRFDEIAHLVGYPNYEQFSRTFKKYLKKSPKDFKDENIIELF